MLLRLIAMSGRGRAHIVREWSIKGVVTTECGRTTKQLASIFVAETQGRKDLCKWCEITWVANHRHQAMPATP